MDSEEKKRLKDEIAALESKIEGMDTADGTGEGWRDLSGDGANPTPPPSPQLAVSRNGATQSDFFSFQTGVRPAPSALKLR